mgnify:CR=1 FL=1
MNRRRFLGKFAFCAASGLFLPGVIDAQIAPPIRKRWIPYSPAPDNTAVRLDAAGEAIAWPQQANEFDLGGVTIMAWCYIVTDTTNDAALMCIRGAGILFTGDVAYHLKLYVGWSKECTNEVEFKSGVWKHFAITNSAGAMCTWKSYADGILDVTCPVSVPNNDNAYPKVGNDTYGAWTNGRFTAIKMWTVELSQAEIQAEIPYYNAVKTANLWSVVYAKVHTDLADKSGLGHDASAVGTLTTEAGPSTSVLT